MIGQYLKIWNLSVQKIKILRKISLKVVQIKLLVLIYLQ